MAASVFHCFCTVLHLLFGDLATIGRITLIAPDASLALDLDFQDPVVRDVVGYDGYIPVLEMPGVVRAWWRRMAPRSTPMPAATTRCHEHAGKIEARAKERHAREQQAE